MSKISGVRMLLGYLTKTNKYLITEDRETQMCFFHLGNSPVAISMNPLAFQ